MIALSDLGDIAKAGGASLYDPEFAARQAMGPPPKMSWQQRFQRGARAAPGQVRKIPPRKAALAAAGAAGVLGTGEAIRRDIKHQRETNRQYPYVAGAKGQRQRQEHRNAQIAGLAGGGITGGYIGYAADKQAQANSLRNVQQKYGEWEKSKRNYSDAPNANETFANERERVRVQRLRAMRTSHNPHEKDTAERLLRGMNRPLDEPKRPPWEETAEGREKAKVNAKFKRRYGFGLDEPLRPGMENKIKMNAEKLAWKRGAAIGAVALGGAGLLAARKNVREERAQRYKNAQRRQARMAA